MQITVAGKQLDLSEALRELGHAPEPLLLLLRARFPEADGAIQIG